ncbi:PqqD family protein [Segatella bryantii]|jgi:hypothetical protein|uniref:PqqD family protein n=1 Tax=Segatella bryantii TaxID=77095 RepID=UPI00089CCFF5|nr:PqqD family protein [Segatella bryantii]MBQ3857732.1 PqqD family protein [Prevotella sp.]MEE3415246.1 PqqD family protein [Prevotella sp.]SEA18925.1 Coenzyme PQQ synthesis protein D (PqqD) [Segatella bryantii]
MRAKSGFFLKNICGESIIIAEGAENIDFSKIISMNESSVYLWEKIQNINFTEETLAELLIEEYEVSKEKALTDCHTLIKQWMQAGIIECDNNVEITKG